MIVVISSIRIAHQSQQPSGFEGTYELIVCGYGTIMSLVSAHSLMPAERINVVPIASSFDRQP